MRNAVMVFLTLGICMSVSNAGAERLSKGSCVVWIGLNGNQAQLVGFGLGNAEPIEASEIGVHVAFNRFLSDNWTIALSGGFDAGSSKFKYADSYPNPSLAGTEEKFSSRSFNVRIGGDRYAFINDDVAVYAGPGLMFWRGHGKYEGFGFGVDGDWPDVTQIGFNGRLGLYARLKGHTALFGHMGQVLARNTDDDSAGKNTWWTNHHEGSVGLAVDF
jgi:hypothetical protein